MIIRDMIIMIRRLYDMKTIIIIIIIIITISLILRNLFTIRVTSIQIIVT